MRNFGALEVALLLFPYFHMCELSPYCFGQEGVGAE